MTEQWQELKETITEMRDNDGTGTQQEVCKFLVNYMGVLEKQIQEPKTGHWIKVYEAIGLYRWKCDKCKKHHRAMYDYCPSCGVRMVEPQESEEEE